MAAYNPRECGVCNEIFDQDAHRPRTLPCSHHLCTECITQLIDKGTRQCPFCRDGFKADSATDIMVNHGVEDFIKFSSFRRSMSPEPSDESSALDTYSEPPDESFEPSAPDLEDPDIRTLRKEAASASRHLLVSFQNMRSHIEGSIQKVSSLKTDMRSKKTQIETELIPRVHAILTENSAAVDDLDETHERLIQQLEESGERREHLMIAVEEVDNAITLEEAEKAMDRLKVSHAELQHWIESWKNKSSDDTQVLQNAVKVHNSSKTKISVAINMLSSDEAKCGGEEKEEEIDSDEDSSGPSLPKGLSGHLSLTSLQSLDGQVRKLLEAERVYAFQHLDGFSRTSRLTLVNNDVHLHCLQNRLAPPNANTIDFNDVMRLVYGSSRLVFLDLGDDESTIGRIYIRLAPDTQRGQNFALHCTGEMGPTYANTQLLAVFNRRQKRERIHGGREMTLIKGLSWGGSYMRPWMAGTVGGMAEDSYGARFNIYTKDYPEQMLDKAFGIVEKGLDVIEEVINRDLDISKVKIIDCGLVLHRSPHSLL